jgi:hypothetical protein
VPRGYTKDEGGPSEPGGELLRLGVRKNAHCVKASAIFRGQDAGMGTLLWKS